MNSSRITALSNSPPAPLTGQEYCCNHQKTRKEAVSMRANTSVTLFLLPATFTAVCLFWFLVSGTLDYERQVYSALTLPITAIMFLAWYIIYLVAKRGHKFSTRIQAVSFSDSV